MADRFQVELADGTLVVVEAANEQEAAQKALRGAQGPKERSVQGHLGNWATGITENVGGAMSGLLSLLSQAPNALMPAANPLSPEQASMVQGLPQLPGAIARDVKQRWQKGPVDAFYEDPVGTLLDLSTVAGGAGLLAKGARLPRIAKAAQTVEKVTNPLALPIEAAVKTAQTVGPALQRTGRSAFTKVLQPSKANLMELPKRYGQTPVQRAEQVSDELLSGGYGVSAKGSEKIHGRIGELSDEASELLKNSTAQAPVKSRIEEQLSGVQQTFGEQIMPGKDLRKIKETSNLEDLHPELTKEIYGESPNSAFRALQRRDPNMAEALFQSGQAPMTEQVIGRELVEQIPVQRADALKRGTYGRISERGPWSGNPMEGPELRTQQGLARALRQGIEDVVPDIAPIHREESRLRSLSGFLDDALFGASRRAPIGSPGESFVLRGRAPLLIPGAILRHPALGSPASRGLYGAGKALSRTQSPSEIIRALLAERLATPQEPEF